ncbi:pentapeptide repeat-containing protein [Faecalibacterium sp. Marseille-Q3530]|uniref:pentapeptide repeat-containing protein n=1 Tax=Faecalibacterium sp. Marseille-Q3530 TaxID=2758403 RepID=UPI00351C5921
MPLFATGQNQNLGGSGRSSHRGSSLAGSCLRRSCLRRCSFRGCGFAGSCLRGSRDRSNGRSRRLCGRRSGSGRRAAAGSHTNSQNQSSNDNSNILEFHIPKSPYDLKNSQPTSHRRDRSAK